MTRWIVIVIVLIAGPVLAQTTGSNAGLPFSPTVQFGYPTVQYGPTSGNGYERSNYYYGGGYGGYGYGAYGAGYDAPNSYPTYPGTYSNPIGGGGAVRSATPGRAFPSAREESALGR